MPPQIAPMYLAAFLLGGGIHALNTGHPVIGLILLVLGVLLGLFLVYVFYTLNHGAPVSYPYTPEECPERGKYPEYKKRDGYDYRSGWSVDDDPRTFVSCSRCGFSPAEIYEMNASAVRANRAEQEFFPAHP